MDFSNIKRNLEERGFTVVCFGTKEEAREYLAGMIRESTVGFGGSVTLDEIGLYEALSENNTVFWHWRVPEGESGAEIIGKANKSKIYFSSVNAIAETGEIINIDGTCNRVSSMLYGHEKVYFVIGANKIAPDFESAVYRARNIAAPLNAKRLSKNTPCAAKGDRCYDCKSPDRICRALSVIWEKPEKTPYEIILIDEKLGY